MKIVEGKKIRGLAEIPVLLITPPLAFGGSRQYGTCLRWPQYAGLHSCVSEPVGCRDISSLLPEGVIAAAAWGSTALM